LNFWPLFVRAENTSPLQTSTRDTFLASAGLLLAAVIPLAREALTDPLTVALAASTVLLMLLSKIATLWIVLGAATVSLCASFIGVF
jgi:chromate transporter